jgi:hypothetical protein
MKSDAIIIVDIAKIENIALVIDIAAFGSTNMRSKRWTMRIMANAKVKRTVFWLRLGARLDSSTMITQVAKIDRPSAYDDAIPVKCKPDGTINRNAKKYFNTDRLLN